RRVATAAGSELLAEGAGRAPEERALDILAHHEDALVAAHLLLDRLDHGVEVERALRLAGDGAHRCAPSGVAKTTAAGRSGSGSGLERANSRLASISASTSASMPSSSFRSTP